MRPSRGGVQLYSNYCLFPPMFFSPVVTPHGSVERARESESKSQEGVRQRIFFVAHILSFIDHNF